MDPRDVDSEMHLLRDAFENEGFSAVTYLLHDPLKFILGISKKDGSACFAVVFDSESQEFSLRDPEGLAVGPPFLELRQAVSQGCDLFSIFPSWEMEKFPLLWEHLMEED